MREKSNVKSASAIQSYLIQKSGAQKRAATKRSDRIHCARVECKRLTAALALFKPFIPAHEFDKQKKRLRTAAALLASPRDRHVLRKRLLKESERLGGARGRNLARWVAEKITQDSAEVERRRLKQANAWLERVLADWPAPDNLPGLDELLQKGTRAAFCGAREAFKEAKNDRQPACFHQWRVLTKHLCLQAEMAADMKIEVDPFRLKRLNKLQDKLGRAHDLARAEKFIIRSCDGRDKLLERTQRELAKRRLALEMKLIQKGKRIFKSKKLKSIKP